MREVEALRRELYPHLKFLAAQVKKIEDGERLRGEIAGNYAEYLKREHAYLTVNKALLAEEQSGPASEKEMLGRTVARLKEELAKKNDDHGRSKELLRLEGEGSAVRERLERATRELGRLEGELAARERIGQGGAKTVPSKEACEFAERVERELTEALEENQDSGRRRLSALIVLVKEFIRRLYAQAGIAQGNLVLGAAGAEELATKKKTLEAELAHLEVEEKHISKQVEALRRKVEGEKDASHEAERELFAAMARRSELEAMLVSLRARADVLARDEEQFKMELLEAGVLVGRAALLYEECEIRDEHGVLSDAELAQEERPRQEERRRKLERVKMKLEEMDAGNAGDILKEHKETALRDAFLSRELEDLERGAASLRALIAELTATLETRFAEGIEKINTEFDTFFKLMFGGGNASVSIVREKKARSSYAKAVEEDIDDEDEKDEDAEYEQGIELSVSLPHKRIKGLHMLSGGERALTSIALIFAMSQVNPPPFLILDETDAALDEANSRRPAHPHHPQPRNHEPRRRALRRHHGRRRRLKIIVRPI